MEPTTAQLDLQRLLSHSDWLRSLARRLVKDASAADDLVQETWLAAMKSPPDPARPVRPWLAGVVRRQAAMRARSEGRRARRQTVAARKDALPSTAELIEGVDTQRRLAGTVLGLAEPYRTTVLLRYYNDLSAAEIARRQGVPAGTVRWRLKRGLEEMRGKLDKSYETRGAWCAAFLSLARTGSPAGEGALAATTSWLSNLTFWQTAGALLLAVLAGLGLRALVTIDDRPEPVHAGLSVDGSTGGARGVAELEESGVVPASRSDRTDVGAANPERAASIRVVDAEGNAAKGLEAVWVHANGAGETLVTDRNGRVFLPTGTERGTLFVRRVAAFIQRAEIEFEGSELEPVDSAPAPRLADGREPVVRFPEESIFSGRIEIAGEAPDRPIELELDYDQEIYGSPLPRVVEKAFGMVRRSSTKTDASGRFQFLVPSGWSGELWFPPGLVIDADWKTKLDGTREHIEGAQEDYVAQLKVLPRISGRLLEADGVTPTPRPRMFCTIVWEDGKVRNHSRQGREDGTFELILPRTDARSITFDVGAGGDMRGQRSFSFGREAIEDGLALGDVVIEPAANVPFEVLDTAGAPIAGAAARIVGTRTVSGRTDDFGRSTVAVPEGEPARLSFGAPGYEPVERDVEPSEAELTVHLGQTARLALTAVDALDTPLSAARVRVLVDAPLFEGSGSMRPDAWSADVLEGGVVNAREHEPGRPGVVNFRTSNTGLLVLENIVTSTAIVVRVLDVTGTPMVEHEVAPLAPGEQRALTLKATAPTRTLRGTVLDEDGAVLVGVRVVIRSSGHRLASDRSGRTGKFEFSRVATETLTIDLDKRGYTPRILRDVVVPSDGRELMFTLARGRAVAVLARDGNGTGVAHGVVSAAATSDDRTWQAVEVEPGRHVLKDLPDEEVRVALEVGGARYEKLHDPRHGELAFELPVHGRLLAHWTIPEGAVGTESFRLRLVPKPSAPEARPGMGTTRQVEVERHVEAAGATTGEEHFEALLPGTYEIHLESRRDARQGPWLAIGEPREVTVVAGDESLTEI